MIRLTEIKLPLNHAPEELTTAITTKLKISAEKMASFVMFKRGYDALCTIYVWLRNAKAV